MPLPSCRVSLQPATADSTSVLGCNAGQDHAGKQECERGPPWGSKPVEEQIITYGRDLEPSFCLCQR